MADTTKDTIYVDIDDEITGIIDKMRASNAKIVALVLPKRASVFQSVVNMKLLKRATEQAKKHIVLITSEAGLLPLAGAVGIHVAKTLATKPEIPAAPLADDGREEMVEESASLDDEPEEITAATAGATPVGELAGLAAADGVETISLADEDDDQPPEADTADMAPEGAAAAADAKSTKKPRKNKKLHIPNFERFRLVLILLVIAALIVVGLIFALSVLPKASISIQTDASNVNTSVALTLDTSASSLNAISNDVPAKEVTEQKSYTATVPASGQQNNGETATGTVTFSAPCSDGAQDIPAGTGVSTNGMTYITQNNAELNVAQGKGISCMFSATTDINAEKPGASYNTTTDPATFTLAASNNNSYTASSISASGTASGGTDEIQSIVQQSDIDTAEGKINTQNTAKQDLEQQLQQDNLMPIPITYNAGTPTITPSTPADSPASNVTVTETITYSMYGARAADLNTLLINNIKSQVNAGSQGILNTGLSNASFTSTNGSTNQTSLTMASTAEVGPNISTATVKQQAEGKKSGIVVGLIKNDANVTGVTVHLSPFWVTTVPKKASKITVTVAKPTNTASNASNS